MDVILLLLWRELWISMKLISRKIMANPNIQYLFLFYNLLMQGPGPLTGQTFSMS
jgi:hypothetical protein